MTRGTCGLGSISRDKNRDLNSRFHSRADLNKEYKPNEPNAHKKFYIRDA